MRAASQAFERMPKLCGIGGIHTFVDAMPMCPCVCICIVYGMQVMLLARGGHQLYYGSAHTALRYFSRVPLVDIDLSDRWTNPAEVCLLWN